MQRVNTKIVIDMGTMETLSCEGYWYDGPVALCGGAKGAKGGGVDPYAEQRAAEEARKQQATETIASMGKTFDETFTPKYWEGYESDLRGFYTPQSEQQYAEAMKDLRTKFGGAQGSAQRSKINELKRAYSTASDALEAQIARQVADEQSRIAGKRTDLTSTINLSSDPAGAVGNIGSLVQGLQLPPAPSPIDTGLGSLVNSWITGKLASGIGQSGGFNINPYKKTTGGGSSIIT